VESPKGQDGAQVGGCLEHGLARRNDIVGDTS
jgi:hypothetical protein